MLTSFSVPAANGRSSPSFSDASASLSGTNPPYGENPILIDPQIKSQNQVVKICVPMSGHGMLNPIPYVTSFVTHLLAADPQVQLLSDDPTVASITKPSEIPRRKNQPFYRRAANTWSPQTVCFLSQVSFNQVSFPSETRQPQDDVLAKVPSRSASGSFPTRICPCTRQTAIGFIHDMHPTFTNRDMLKSNWPRTWKL
jgi:hypothetical protein